MVRAPGWYPDPDDPGHMRRWDGLRWTPERRNVPSWYGAPPEQPRRRWSRRRWATATVVVGCLMAALALRALRPSVDLPPRTVADAAFVAQANTLCRADLAPLRAARPQEGSPEAKNPGTEAQVADRAEQAASKIDGLLARLRGLPVAGDDRADVDGWLADWGRYAAYGHRYAEAARARQWRTYNSIAAAASRPGQRANLFARANGLDDCTF